MFEKIHLKGLKKSPMFGYAAAVPFFEKKSEIAFKPGLNILIGANGCGKSTILKMLGYTMCAVQGGISNLTQNSIDECVDMFAGMSGKYKTQGMPSKIALQVDHDGQPVVFCDPRTKVGLNGGSFDDDFFEQGILEATSRNKASHGQASLSRLGLSMQILMGKVPFPENIVRQINKKNVNDLWGAAIDTLELQMKPSIEKGQTTILLDEPEANFSLVWQARLWSMLADPQIAERHQIIVATHSAFALGIDHANYIEFEPGFRDEAESALKLRFDTTIKA